MEGRGRIHRAQEPGGKQSPPQTFSSILLIIVLLTSSGYIVYARFDTSSVLLITMINLYSTLESSHHHYVFLTDKKIDPRKAFSRSCSDKAELTRILICFNSLHFYVHVCICVVGCAIVVHEGQKITCSR